MRGHLVFLSSLYIFFTYLVHIQKNMLDSTDEDAFATHTTTYTNTESIELSFLSDLPEQDGESCFSANNLKQFMIFNVLILTIAAVIFIVVMTGNDFMVQTSSGNTLPAWCIGNFGYKNRDYNQNCDEVCAEHGGNCIDDHSRPVYMQWQSDNRYWPGAKAQVDWAAQFGGFCGGHFKDTQNYPVVDSPKSVITAFIGRYDMEFTCFFRQDLNGVAQVGKCSTRAHDIFTSRICWCVEPIYTSEHPPHIVL